MSLTPVTGGGGLAIGEKKPHLEKDNQNFQTGTIWNADNLEVMRGMNSQTVDLIYLDPPFNSAKNYKGSGNASSQEFNDNWSEKQLIEWDMLKGIRDNVDLVRTQDWWPMMELVKEKHSKEMYYYLGFMAVRLLQMKRLLKDTGCIYLHCDDMASAHLKFLMDAIFGKDNYRNRITWRRHHTAKFTRIKFARNSDDILFYSATKQHEIKPVRLTYHNEKTIKQWYRKTDSKGRYIDYPLTGPGVSKGLSGQVWRGANPKGRHWAVPNVLKERYEKETGKELHGTVIERLDELADSGYIEFNSSGNPSWRKYLSDAQPPIVDNIWDDEDVKPLGRTSKERTGWATQKPLSLLKRILVSSSEIGDVVFDPFCGCATTLIAAATNDRRFIGCDIDEEVCDIVTMRWQHTADMFFESTDRNIRESIHITKDLPERSESIAANDPLSKLTRSDVRGLYGRDLYGLQEGYCPGCKEHEKFKNMDVDHIIPRKQGGTNDRENLQLLCRKCNTSKGGRTMEEWQADRQRNIL